MAYSDLVNRFRHWDNRIANWVLRHVYVLFFQFVLVFIFIIWFINSLFVLDFVLPSQENATLERILVTQSINTSLVVFILLLNSFWLLFIFSTMQRLRSILKDISFNTSRWRNKNPG